MVPPRPVAAIPTRPLGGDLHTFMGTRLDPVVQGPGEFLFIPAGVAHLPANLSSQNPVLALVCRSDPKFYESLELLPDIDTVARDLLPQLRQQHDTKQPQPELGEER